MAISILNDEEVQLEIQYIEKMLLSLVGHMAILAVPRFFRHSSVIQSLLKEDEINVECERICDNIRKDKQ